MLEIAVQFQRGGGKVQAGCLGPSVFNIQHIRLFFIKLGFFYKRWVYAMYTHVAWDIHRQRITSLRFVVTITTLRENIGIMNESNLRICMDTKFCIPWISGTYVSVAP